MSTPPRPPATFGTYGAAALDDASIPVLTDRLTLPALDLDIALPATPTPSPQPSSDDSTTEAAIPTLEDRAFDPNANEDKADASEATVAAPSSEVTLRDNLDDTETAPPLETQPVEDLDASVARLADPGDAVEFDDDLEAFINETERSVDPDEIEVGERTAVDTAPKEMEHGVDQAPAPPVAGVEDEADVQVAAEAADAGEVQADAESTEDTDQEVTTAAAQAESGVDSKAVDTVTHLAGDAAPAERVDDVQPALAVSDDELPPAAAAGSAAIDELDQYSDALDADTEVAAEPAATDADAETIVDAEAVVATEDLAATDAVTDSQEPVQVTDDSTAVIELNTGQDQRSTVTADAGDGNDADKRVSADTESGEVAEVIGSTSATTWSTVLAGMPITQRALSAAETTAQAEALHAALLERVSQHLTERINATVRDLMQPAIDEAVLRLAEEAQLALRITLQELLDQAVREELASRERGDAADD